ncbi:hypothetical protein Tco_0444754 [Tanacetum coccineum]
MPTEMELELEQTQQGSSHEVSVQVKMEMEIPRSSRVNFITTCSYSTDISKDLMKAKNKRVRFAKPVTSSSNIPKKTDSLKTKDSNKPLLNSTGVKPTTSASGSKPSGNTKNNKIMRPPCSNQKIK